MAAAGRWLAMIASGLLGGLLVWTLRTAEAPPADEMAGMADLRREVSALTDEIRGLRQAFAMPSQAAPSPPTQPIEPLQAVDWPELVTRLEQLLARPVPAGDPSQTHGIATTLVIPPATSTAQARRELVQPNQSRWDLQQQHLLMPPQQILDRYGSPSFISHDDHGAVKWYYEPPKEREDEERRTFVFADGYVIDVY